MQPANSYQLALESASTGRSIQWITEVDGKPIRFDADPDVDAGKRAVIRMLSLLPTRRACCRSARSAGDRFDSARDQEKGGQDGRLALVPDSRDYYPRGSP